MSRKLVGLLALSVLTTLAAACGGSSGQQSGLPPYAKRLDLVQRLAVRYPGAVDPSVPLGKYGLWAGILVQTRWQRSSRRDRIPLWSIVNDQLSVRPTAYERMRSCPPTHLQTAPGGPAADERTVCQAWKAYFVGARAGRSQIVLEHLLWRAHTTAITYALVADRAALARAGTTTLERNFWSSWIEIVFLLEAIDFPTNARTSVPASRGVMPLCSPIGAEGCALTRADLGSRYSFVAALARRPASTARIFRLYEALHSRPLALVPLLADRSLAAALADYVRAGKGS